MATLKKHFEVCVRGVIIRRGKILVCRHKEKKYYFFPGGHIDFGETAEAALLRELKEEDRKKFVPPEWFGLDITQENWSANSVLSEMSHQEVLELVDEMKFR